MPLVDQPFATTFTFVRACAAPVRNVNGGRVTAAINAPRFDFVRSDVPAGLLVEGPPTIATADRLTINGGDWDDRPVTILHAWQGRTGPVALRAWYSQGGEGQAIVNACLARVGHHREIHAVPGFLRNRGGFVRWRNRFWSLGGLFLVEGGVALGQTPDRMLLEG